MKNNLMKIITTAVFGVLFVVAGVFALSEYKNYAHYSNDADAISAAAASSATADQSATDKTNTAEALKGVPNEKLGGLTTKLKYAHFKSPQQFATIEFDYPLTWSVYEKNDATKVTDENNYDVYFDEGRVKSTAFKQPHSLHVNIVDTTYEDTLATFRKLIDSGALSATPYVVPGHEDDADYSGVKLDGQLEQGVSGTALILKTREKTMIIRSDLASTMDDFENIVLPSFKFVP
jgi:hypothetical protein